MTIARCCLGTSLLAVSLAAYAQGPRIKTSSGTLEGALTPDAKVAAFQGIPYAAPPLGGLRWKAPQPPAPWTGVRPAKAFGYHCVQTTPFPDMQFHDPGASEDCLTLNVWAPASAKPGSLPVMVWIYGGGYTGGGSSEGRQDGQFLAHHDVVVVSMNYRLGIFGFFAHPGLTAESPHHASGNYGLMDQAAALAWVKQNIRAFGGNPDNITLFGESAGSFAVSTLMASPITKGMLAHAIGESGGAFGTSGLSTSALPAAEQADAAWAAKALGSDALAQLRQVPTEDVIRAVNAKDSMPPRFAPIVDGYFLPESVPAIYAAGRQAQIPLLAGWNADEGRSGILAMKDQPTLASLNDLAAKSYPGREKDFLAAYHATTDAEAVDVSSDYAGDRFIAFATWSWLEAQRKTSKAPIYRYFFSLPAPDSTFHPASSRAFHSDDIEYVFGALDSRPGAVWRPEDRALSDQMMAYWTNFARTGDPNGPGLPAWPKYGPTDWQVMRLDAISQAAPDTRRPRYLFLEQAATAH